MPDDRADRHSQRARVVEPGLPGDAKERAHEVLEVSARLGPQHRLDEQRRVGEEAGDRGRALVRTLRAEGVPADTSFEDRPLKAQLRMANRAGARYVLIVGEREAQAGTVTVRRLEDGHEETVPATDVATWISQQA